MMKHIPMQSLAPQSARLNRDGTLHVTPKTHIRRDRRFNRKVFEVQQVANFQPANYRTWYLGRLEIGSQGTVL